MKKILFFVVTLCIVLVSTSCYAFQDSIHDDDIPDDNETSKSPSDNVDINTMLPTFDSVEEFKKVYADIPNSIYRKSYVDLNSIISNEEVKKIVIGLDSFTTDTDLNKVTKYTITYESINETKEGLYIVVGYGKDFFGDHYFSPAKESILAEGKTYNALKDVPEDNSESFVCNVDEICMLYSYYNGKIETISFMIDEHYFMIYANRSASPAQDEFISAFLPELGATDDSVIAMLDKIKALIPKE
ncbi:MAG: hypothetical protein E7633_08215 [Ruminococcaceae bacterium]|nr:hypothetical protein [Oscillospiraceae bacterium]